MTRAPQKDSSKRSAARPNHGRLLLQRKCACGGSSGLTGSCSDCEKKKLLDQPLQTKLRINEPGDEYEQEADRVAEQVMRMAEPGKETNSSIMATASLVQRQVNPNSAGIGTAPPIVHDVLASPGQPLDAATRAFFEPRFEHDFSRVRVHRDAKAAESARSVNALAYTVGDNVVLSEGQNSPDKYATKELLAHELVHVVQQTGEDSVPTDAFIPRRENVSGSTSVPDLLQREPGEAAASCNDMVFYTFLDMPRPMKNRYFADGEEIDKSKHDAGIAGETANGKCNISLTQEVGLNLGPLNPGVTVNFFYRGEPCCKCFAGTLSWDVVVSGIPQPHQIGRQRVNAGAECSVEKCCPVSKSLPISLDISLGKTFHVNGTIQLDGSTYKQTS
jgi:hypothetical protein